MKRYSRHSIYLLILLLFAGCKPDTIKIPRPAYPDVKGVQTTPWPEWIFHHWVWEGEGTSTSARQLVADYKSHGIPVGAIIIDSPWETDYNTMIPDHSLYPDMKAMVDDFHSQNVRVLFWVTGIIDTNVHPLFDYGKSHNYYMKVNASTDAVVHWWKGDGSLIDYYNPDAMAWWRGLVDSALALGIDGWKCDGTDFSVNLVQYSPGLGRNIDSRNDYSHQYYNFFMNYTRQKLGIDRAITCRPIDNYGTGLSGDAVSFAPKEIGWSCWVGDQDATYTGMTNALNNMYWSDQYGYLGFGSDIGGYRENSSAGSNGRTAELFIRWAELGAFCPMMENGGGGEHRPWMFDQATTDAYKKFVLLREQMVPYLIQTASKRFSQGRSMMNFFNHSDYSYMLGDDIFVTPVLADGGIVQLHFPAGNNWVYLFDKSRTYSGGTSTTLIFANDQFPVFVKEGSPLLQTLNP